MGKGTERAARFSDGDLKTLENGYSVIRSSVAVCAYQNWFEISEVNVLRRRYVFESALQLQLILKLDKEHLQLLGKNRVQAERVLWHLAEWSTPPPHDRISMCRTPGGGRSDSWFSRPTLQPVIIHSLMHASIGV